MVGVIHYKITGLDTLEKNLKGLGSEVASKIGVDSLSAAAKPLLKAMRDAAPVKTGALRKSITSIAIKQANKSTLLSRVIGFRSPGRYYSHLVEFGTAHSAARPFIRPALDANNKKAIDEMAKRIWYGIQVYTAALAFRSVKGL